MYIIIAILIFGFLVATHELGHFTVAKLCGVKVNEFSIGMGPAIFQKQGKETLYSLRLLPFGGFCAMDEDESSDDPKAFTNQSHLKRLLILAAGAGMNFITGVIILLFLVPGSMNFMKPVITDFFEDCPYKGENALMEGDEFYKVDGDRVYFSSNVGFLLSHNGGDIHDIVVIRDGEKVELKNFKLVPHEYEIEGQTVKKYGFYFGVVEKGFGAVLKNTWYCSLDFIRMVWMGLSDLVTGAVGIKDLAGPVGIVDMINDVGNTADTTAHALWSIAYLAAFIAINLAVMNLLPIPALDGGRILFLLIALVSEKIFKKKLDPKYEGYIHTTGLILLLGLMAVVMVNDVLKLFN